MRILGIHGRATIVASQNTLWNKRAEDIRARGHQIYIPQLDESDDPRYEAWAVEIDDFNIESYDCVIAISHGSGVLARYIIEKQVQLKRVVFCSPGRAISKREHTAEVYDFLENNNVALGEFVDEIFIVHGVDDENVPLSEGEKFHKQVGGEFYALEGFGHKLDEEALTFINDLAINGKQ